jgi:hypothetical protein
LGLRLINKERGPGRSFSEIAHTNGHFLADTTKHENMEQPASAVLKGIMAGSARPTDRPLARQ